MPYDIDTSATSKVEAFKRQLLDNALSECTIEQQAFFKRVYPGDVPESKLISAIELCERTIKKNQTKQI